jgi:hypothetical protein
VQKKGIPRFADAGKSISIGPPLKWAKASLSGVANQLCPLAGSTVPTSRRESPRSGEAFSESSMGSATSIPARMDSSASRSFVYWNQDHGRSVPAASCSIAHSRIRSNSWRIMRGSWFVIRGQRSAKAASSGHQQVVPNLIGSVSLVRIARENIEVCRSECPLWVVVSTGRRNTLS